MSQPLEVLKVKNQDYPNKIGMVGRYGICCMDPLFKVNLHTLINWLGMKRSKQFNNIKYNTHLGKTLVPTCMHTHVQEV